MQQLDRRVRRTQNALKDALIELALEIPYDEINIQDITTRADIGYRTFFRHYADKDALLKDVINTTMLEMRELMTPPPANFYMDGALNGKRLMDSAELFRYVQKNSNLYRVLLFSDQTIVQSLKTYAIQEIKEMLEPMIPHAVPFDILLYHMISAEINLVRWWLKSGMILTPEEMGEYSYELVLRPIRELILTSQAPLPKRE